MRLLRAAMAVSCLVAVSACGDSRETPDDLDANASGAYATANSYVVYDDILENGFVDHSASTHDIAFTAASHSGKSISFEPDSHATLVFQRSTTFDVTAYGSVSFWIDGGGGSNQAIDVALYAGSAIVSRVHVSSFASIKAWTWLQVSIPVSAFSGAKLIDGFGLVDTSGINQERVFVDDIAFTGAAVVSPPPPTGGTETVYDEKLETGVSDWSWATHNLAATTPVHSGTHAISFEPDSWGALFFEFDRGLDLSTHTTATFWVNGASKVSFALVKAGKAVTNTAVTGVTGTWTKVTVDLTKLGVSGVVDGLWLADSTGTNQATLYVDDMVMTTTSAPVAPAGDVTVAVDRTASRRAINPEIYGVNYGADAEVKTMRYPSRRWGGNATTRYSWQNDMSNTGSDWFFMNTPQSSSTSTQLPNGSAADTFIDATRAAGAQALITVPTIGWVAIDQTKRWSYSVAKFGAQQQTECTASGYASWCTADAGNGVLASGAKIPANPADTSKTIDPTFVQGWISHIQSRVGTAAAGGVRYYSLDNEPSLWNSTHRDVHPNGLTYDELWQKTSAYGHAIKASDPQAKTFGPAEWGWCGYLDSSGGCGASPDRKNHGDLPMLAWYLQKVCSEQATTGVRVVDYLDVHYYPQATNVSLTSDESAATQALRLRSVKSLYDPAYTDESWIATPIELIPRMRDWIATYCPGVKLAVTEYQFGNDAGVTAALAQAETLAIFGREGVDFATRWVAPAANTLVEDAFKLFLNYDGAGSQVTGTSVHAVSSNVDSVASYAVEGADGEVRLVLVNHDTVAHSVKVTLAGAHTIAVYGFDGAQRLGARGSITGDGTTFTVPVGARSATLAVVTN